MKIGYCCNCNSKLQWEIIDLCDNCKDQLARDWFTKQRENNNSVIQSKHNVELYHAMTSGLYEQDYL